MEHLPLWLLNTPPWFVSVMFITGVLCWCSSMLLCAWIILKMRQPIDDVEALEANAPRFVPEDYIEQARRKLG